MCFIVTLKMRLDILGARKYHRVPSGRFKQMAKMGRPKLEEPRNNKASIRLTDRQMARLEAYCEKFQLTKAQTLMKGLEELYRQDEEPKKSR